MPARGTVRRARSPAFAKVNLGLRVLGRRPDGYHEIRTVFQSVGFHDRVQVSFRPGRERRLDLECDHEDLNHEGNLAWRAADRLMRRMRLDGHVRIRLAKRIPAGAGLGGGSSDAATVLRLLPALLEEPPSRKALHEVAAALGSDVPYFLLGGTVAASGRGTRLAPIRETAPLPIVLVLPDIKVSTEWAYGALADSRESRLPSAASWRMLEDVSSERRPLDSEALGRSSEWMLNDFESVVFQRFPALGEIKRQILACGAHHALLSGSGSALFGIFEGPDEAARAARRLAAEGMQAMPTQSVSRADCEGAIVIGGEAPGTGSGK